MYTKYTVQQKNFYTSASINSVIHEAVADRIVITHLQEVVD